MSASNAATQQSQYLTFWIAGEEYAASVLRVREILAFTPPTRVPGTPACIRGVLNLRGTVVPLVDLAVKFGLPEMTITRWTCIVIVELELDGEITVLGVMTDAVSQVIELGAADIEPPPAFGTRIRVDYLLGLAKVGQKFVLILDLERMLSTNELLAAVSLQSSPDATESPTTAAVEASGP